jgi:hypothetical protein
VFLAALFALPMSAAQLELYRKYTGRSTPPTEPLHEAWLICGRRAGKSFVLAVIAVFLACFKDWRPYLGPGEVGTIMVIAKDRRQARVIKRFITGLLQASPMLRRVIEDETAETIRLRNRVTVEIHTASFRSTRGYTIIAALLDEVAIWPTDETSSEPDIEVINAIKPGMATIPEAMLLCASSPHARKGALWNAHRRHFGKDNDPVLVWKGTTRDMNATVPQAFIDAHLAEDAARAGAEYLAQFRTDLESYVDIAVVEGCVGDHREMLPAVGTAYTAFVDPASGSGEDSFTCAVGHKTKDGTIIIDAVREVRPFFSPSTVIDDLAVLLRSYRMWKVSGDHYAGEFPRELFRKHGIAYEPCKSPKSDLYRDLLPLLNSGRIVLPRNDRLVTQIVGLERRVTRAGKDSIDHGPNGHDDIVNAIAGCAIALRRPSYNLAALAS